MWKLECETREEDPITRLDIYDMVELDTINKKSNVLRPHLYFGGLFVSILSASMLAMALVISLRSFCMYRNCGRMLGRCSSSSNGSFACSMTAIAALVFFNLLIFYEALVEAKEDVKFKNETLPKINYCLGGTDEIGLSEVNKVMDDTKIQVYEAMFVLLLIYVIAFVVFALPSFVCLQLSSKS